MDVLSARAGWTIARGRDARGEGQRVWEDPAGSIVLDRLADGYALDFPGLGRLRVNIVDRTVAFRPAGNGLAAATLHHLLIDQVLPRLLAHDGRLVLHAGAARDAAGSVAIIGASGLGKSTLTASLLRHGFSLLSDDAILAEAGPTATVQAVCPGLRLLPDALSALYPECPATMPMAEYSPKRRLDLDASSDGNAHPLHLILFLGPPTPQDVIEVRPVPQAQACMKLIANSFALDPTDRPSAARRLAQVSALVAAVPAFALSYPRRYDRLPAVNQAILDTLDAIRAAPQNQPPMGTDR